MKTFITMILIWYVNEDDLGIISSIIWQLDFVKVLKKNNEFIT